MGVLPEAGDVVWVDLDPVPGTEQAGHRPALVVTERLFHEVSGRAIVCPITSRRRGWPTEVPLPHGMRTQGVVLVDQIRSLDRDERGVRMIEHAPDDVLRQVRGRLAEILNIVSVFR